MWKPFKLKESNRKHKKYEMIFINEDGKKKSSHFGDNRYEDYTIHKDDERKKNYIKRHGAQQDWTDPTKPLTLSRYILWNKPTIKQSLKDYIKRFFSMN